MISDYEQMRNKNIKRNREYCESLGFGAFNTEPPKAKKPRRKRQNLIESTVPARRSGRLSGTTPESPSGLDDAFKEPSAKDHAVKKRKPTRSSSGEAGSSTLDYGQLSTVEHLNALGSCVRSYDDFSEAEGRLPYQPKDGTATKSSFSKYMKDTGTPQAKSSGAICHWCRQKDTSLKAECTRVFEAEDATAGKEEAEKPLRRCRVRLCGPCLQSRFGECLFELPIDGTWTCPVCRNICNCSDPNCLRHSKGLGSTGALQHFARAAGYESAGHYLVLGFFDDVVTALADALAKEAPESEELNELLEVCGEMKLDTPVTAVRFNHTGTPSDETVPTAAISLSDRKLFKLGHSAAEVVLGLKALAEQARAVVAAGV